MDLANKKVDFLGIPLDALTMDETVQKISMALKDGERINHVVINAGKVVAMQENDELYQSVVSCDLINADGQSIVWGARFLGLKVPERVAGIDLMQNLIRVAAANGHSCFLFGAKQHVVESVAEMYKKEYGEEVIAGYRNGYYEKEEEEQIAQQIEDSGAQLLFVAMPSPKKENFMYTYRNVMRGLIFNMGVGGSFDVVAGETKRAPVWMQKIGLEWFFRFIQEPGRMWRRYLVGNSKFIWLIIKARLRNYAS